MHKYGWRDGNRLVKYIDCSIDTRTGLIYGVALRLTGRTERRMFRGDDIKGDILNWLKSFGDKK